MRLPSQGSLGVPAEAGFPDYFETRVSVRVDE